MAVKANVKSIEALRPRAERYDESVSGRPGLVVRVWPSGTVVFLHRFKVRGQAFRVTLGEYPAISLNDFLSRHQAQRDQLARGENPATIAVQVAHARDLAPTVGELARRYLEEHARPNKRSADKDEAILNRDVLPKWKRLLARDITKADVKSLINKIRADKERGRTAHRKVLAVTRKMFSFAVDAELMGENPAKGIPVGEPPAPRQRYLNDAELRAFWTSLPKMNMLPEAKDALRLQLLTGTRIGEPLGAVPSEFDLSAREWRLPSERTKNKLPLILPLSDQALAIVEPRITAASQEGADGVLFPSGRKGRALLPGGLAHALSRELSGIKGDDGKPIASFTTHDLRRTVETNLARLGVAREIRDRILNHKDSSISGKHYNVHDYLPEKRAALEAWARKLGQIVSGKESTVTPLRRMENRSRRG